MSNKVKGMVQLAGITYRIVRVSSGSYSVVRIRDDIQVGSFSLAPTLGVKAERIDADLMREIARLAIHTAKTSYVGFPRPDVTAVEVVQAVNARRAPSSMPPPTLPTPR